MNTDEIIFMRSLLADAVELINEKFKEEELRGNFRLSPWQQRARFLMDNYRMCREENNE